MSLAAYLNNSIGLLFLQVVPHQKISGERKSLKIEKINAQDKEVVGNQQCQKKIVKIIIIRRGNYAGQLAILENVQIH